MSDSISDELNYETKISNHSTLNWRNIAPQSNSSQTLDQVSGGQITEFILNPTVFNPSDSRLEWSELHAAKASNFIIADGNGKSRIQRLVCYDSATNAVLCDISNQDKISEMLTYAISKDELKTKPYLRTRVPATTVADAQLKTLEAVQRSNSVATKSNLLFGSDSSGDEDVVDASTYEPYTGLRHTVCTSAVNEALAIDWSLKLSEFKGSFLAVNNMIYSPSNLIIQIYWAPIKNFAVASTVDDNSGTLSTTTSCVISNINLVVAIEANLAITSKVISKVMGEGITMNVPYISTVKNTLAQSTAHSFSLQITRAYGNRLLFVAVAPFSKETGHINNHSLGKITHYQTTLNSNPLKIPAGFNTLKNEDYILGNKAYVEGSCIESSELFKQKWMHVDSFFGEKPIHSVDMEAIDGLDLTAQSSVYTFEATLSGTGTALDYYVLLCGQKTITLSSMGATIQ